MKKVITITGSNTITYIGSYAQVTSAGIDVGGVLFPNGMSLNLYDVETIPADVRVYTHTYTPTDGFQVNPNYNTPVDIEELQQVKDKVDALESEDFAQRVADLELALADLFTGGGGL
jgi:hypothetical protein